MEFIANKTYNQSSAPMKVLYSLRLFKVTKDGKPKLEPFMLIAFIPTALLFMCGVLGIVMCLLSLIMTITIDPLFGGYFGYLLFPMAVFTVISFVLLPFAIRIMAGFDGIDEICELIRTRGTYTLIESTDDPRYIAMEEGYAEREAWARQRAKEIVEGLE